MQYSKGLRMAHCIERGVVWLETDQVCMWGLSITNIKLHNTIFLFANTFCSFFVLEVLHFFSIKASADRIYNDCHPLFAS